MQVCVRCAGPILAGQASCGLCGAVAPVAGPPGPGKGRADRAPQASVRVCARCAGPVLAGQSSCGLCGAAAPAPATSQALPGGRPRHAEPEGDDDEVARNRAPNCYQCTQFMITHQVGQSRGCRLFGFKGDELPSYVVFQVTGKACVFFEKRPTQE